MNESNLLKQIWGIHSQSAATLNDMYCSILQPLLHKNVTAQKYWYHLARWKTALISLNHAQYTQNSQICMLDQLNK